MKPKCATEQVDDLGSNEMLLFWVRLIQNLSASKLQLLLRGFTRWLDGLIW